MTELFFIFSQFFIIYLLSSLNVFVLINKNYYLKVFSFSENLSFNLIIFLNFILLVSFFNVNLFFIISTYLTYYAILFLIYLINHKTLININKINTFYFILLYISSSIIFIEVANNLVVGWDAQKFWIYKTLNFYNDNSISNLSNLPNSWYPYLGSLSWSFFWKLGLLEHEYSGRLFYVFIYLTSLLLITNNLKLSISNKVIFFLLTIILSYDYTIHSHWSMFSGFQEILIFSLLSIAVHFLYKLSKSNHNLQNLNLFSILMICNLLVWIKHEGFIISLSLILTLIFFFKFELRKKIFICIFFFLIIFFRFFIFEFYDLNSSNIQHHGFEKISIENILNKFSFLKIPIIVKYLFLNIFTNYLMLISFFILIFFLITKKKIKSLNYTFFLFIFNLTSFCFIYLFTTSLDLTFLLQSSMDRIIYQLCPLTFLIVFELINKKNFLNKINL